MKNWLCIGTPRAKFQFDAFNQFSENPHTISGPNFQKYLKFLRIYKFIITIKPYNNKRLGHKKSLIQLLHRHIDFNIYIMALI